MMCQQIRDYIIFFLIISAFQLELLAQADTVWTRSYGGSSDEAVGLSLMNNFGSPGLNLDVNGNGIFFTSSSLSSDGLVRANYGSEDVWVVKLDHNGDTLWSKILGGSDFDRPSSIKALADGSCVIAGRTLSNNGFFVGNHGGYDGFVVRLDDNGNVLWKKLYGGSEMDYLYDVIWTSDNHLLVCGETGSNDGDLAGTGTGLSWVMKLNASNGNILWSKTYVGPNGNFSDALENFYRILELHDGSGYVAAGYTVADFNNINGDDIYIHKIDTGGQSVWFKKVGSTNGGEGLGGLANAKHGAFYIAGRLAGDQGNDVTDGYHGGNSDVWLLKIDTYGNKLWDKSFGGTDWEFAYDISVDSMGYVYLGGFTRSTNNDASDPGFGLQDFWVIKTDSAGNMVWNKKMGGSQNDVLHALKIYHHQIIVMGRTNSSDAWIHHSWGGRDIWVAKLLQADGLNIGESKGIRFCLFPNPGFDIIQLFTEQPIKYWELFTVNGIKVNYSNSQYMHVINLPQGVYFANVLLCNGKTIHQKIIVAK
ncbi:MAG: T9SS type A sorting domain-containing protein [Flavobacteriales bacterium]|nr:T9SS type A sorting domain-containing protein [Flavobacteriales bacterium]